MIQFGLIDKDIHSLRDAKNYLYLINPENFRNKQHMLQVNGGEVHLGSEPECA